MTSRGITNLLIDTSLQTFADENPNATNYRGVALTETSSGRTLDARSPSAERPADELR